MTMKVLFSQVDKQIVSEYVERARAALPGIVANAYWFGSRALGAGSCDSDYDLMLEMTSPLTDSLEDLKQTLETKSHLRFHPSSLIPNLEAGECLADSE